MKKFVLKLAMGTVTVASLGLWSCNNEPYYITGNEEYTRAFIKEFGPVDPKHDWNTSRQAVAALNIGENPIASVKIYARKDNADFLVADLKNVSGLLNVPIDIPKGCDELLVRSTRGNFRGNVGKMIDCTAMSRGVYGVTYSDTGTPNPNPAEYSYTAGDYKVDVKHTVHGNGSKFGSTDEYQYLNGQEVAPLISPRVWSSYYSLNTEQISEADGHTGLLPESGVFNRTQQDILDLIDDRRDKGHTLVADYTINTGNDGMFTFFPFYYGTNLCHEVGVYLLDDNGNPLLANGKAYDDSQRSSYHLQDFIYFPVFKDRDKGDMQIQPHYNPNITGIRVADPDNPNEELKGNLQIPMNTTLNLNNLVQIELNNSDTWISYADYLSQYGDQYHGRVAIHFWHEAGTPEYAKINKDGIVTPEAVGTGAFTVAIANGIENATSAPYGRSRVKGVKKDRSYDVVGSSSSTSHTTHTKTASYSQWPSDLTSSSLDDYFDIEDSSASTSEVWTGALSGSDYSTVTMPVTEGAFNNLKAGDVIKIYYNNSASGKINSCYGSGPNGSTHLGGNQVGDPSPMVITLQEWQASGLQNMTGISVEVYQIELTKVEVIRNASTSYNWKDGNDGKPAALNALKTYYEGKSSNMTCGESGCSESLSGATVTVTFADNASYASPNHTVTWTKNASSGAPRYRKPASRATKPALLEDNGNWIEANGCWTRYLPIQEEVASYCADDPMLVRTRGYDVFIEHNKQPYQGELGIYMKVTGSSKLTNEGDNGAGQLEYTQYSDNDQYVVFSQRKFNRDKNGNLYPQISALAVQHPVTGLPFLTFEDMLVTHSEDIPYGATEESSDRDVNDLVFNIANFGTIKGDKEISNINNDGFNWVWTLEDMGAIGDFDFNDVVININSVTISPDADDESAPAKYYKKVTFTPLAAGGTLPVYVYLEYKGNTFVLRPGTFNLTGNNDDVLPGTSLTGTLDNITDGSYEFHKWFGNYSYSQMINTGRGVGGVKGQPCVVYVEAPTVDSENVVETDGFAINPFSNSQVIDNKNWAHSDVKFYISVLQNGEDSPTTEQQKVTIVESLGAAPQSFIINGKSNTWRWPREQRHITLGYPKFGEWVGDNTKTEWLNENVNPNDLY